MKLGMYNMAPDPISSAYFTNPSNQFVSLYVYVAGQRLDKTLSRQRIHMQQYKICQTCRFL
jgi:hypothetical protein